MKYQLLQQDSLGLDDLPQFQFEYRLVARKNGGTHVVIPIPSSGNSKRFWINNAVIAGSCFAGIGVIYSMPEEISNWDHDIINWKNLPRNWKQNVSRAFVLDHDSWVINFVMHPYFGAVYYTSVRGAGYTWWQSALFSFGMSTFFWEFGVEAIAEKPSIQDLLSTPIVGSGMGELFFQAKVKIKENDDRLLGSRFLGHACIFLMDPVNEVTDWFRMGRVKRQLRKRQKAQLSSKWTLDHSNVCLNVRLAF